MDASAYSAALFAAVAAHHGERWTPSEAPKFGANALRVNGKVFAALTRSQRLLLKLPRERIAELLKTKRAMRFESGGRVMNGWITVAPDNLAEWVALSDEARAFISAATERARISR